MKLLFEIFFVFVFLLGLKFKKSKGVFCLQIFLMWILLGWNAGGIDYSVNQTIFLSGGKTAFQGLSSGWILNLVYYICHRFSWTFIQYNILTMLVALSVFAYIIWKMTSYPCVVLEFYLIYPFMDSLIQKRFFIGMVFSLLGLYFLKDRKRLLYLLCILIATGIHFSFSVLFLLVFWIDFDRKKENYFIAGIVGIEVFLLVFGRNIIALFFNSQKLETYLLGAYYSSSIVGLCFAAAIAIYIICFGQVNIWIRKSGSEENKKLSEFVWRLNKVAFVLVPLCYIESTFMRYFRLVLFWDFIVISREAGRSLLSGGKLRFQRQESWILIFTCFFIVVNLILYMSGDFSLWDYCDTVMNNALLN